MRIAPHEERTLSLTKLWNSIRAGHPLAAFKGNYTQRDVMQEVRRRMAEIRAAAIQRAQCAVVQHRRRPAGHRLCDSRAGPGGFGTNTRKTCAQRLREIGGIVDADTTLKLDKPELRVQIDRARAADLGVDTSDIADGIASDGWRRRPGDRVSLIRRLIWIMTCSSV